MNSFHSLGRINETQELVSKIFRYLLKEWDAKVTTIIKVKDLNNYELD